MSRELPLYQGATPQAPQQQMQGPGFTPHVQPMGGMLDAAVQAGLGAGEQYAELKDFGASQQAEHQRRVHDQQMRKEFESRLRLPWGSEGSFYDSEGNRREDEVNAFIIKWQEKNNSIPRPFWLEKNAMRDEGDLMQANDALASRVELMTLDAEAKNRKQAFQDNYDLAVEQEDWPGVHRVIDRAVEAGQITRARGDEMRLKVDKTSALHHFKNLAATNPDLAAEMINRGELDGYFSVAEQDERMRSLRRQDDKAGYLSMNQFSSIPAKTKGKDKQEDLQEKYNELQRISRYPAQLEINQYFAEHGHFEGVRPQIHNILYDLTERVAPGDKGPGFLELQEELIALCKLYDMPSEIKTRLLQRMDKRAAMNQDLPLLNVGDRLESMRGIKLYRQADYNNEVGMMHEESEAAYALYKQSAVASGQEAESKNSWMEKDKKERLASLEKGLAAQSGLEIKMQFDAWLVDATARKQGEPPDMVTQELNLQRIIRDVTGRQDVVIPRMGAAADGLFQATLNQEKIKAYDAEKRLGKTVLTKSEAEVLAKHRFISPATFSGSVSVDRESSSLPAGVLLPESMKDKVGGDPGKLAVMVPAPGNSRQGRLLPVVGFRKGDGIRITPKAASKMRITRYQRLNGNISVHPATQAMQSYLKSEYMSESDDGVLPMDYGILPIETAEPVSSVYTNEAGTTDALLPPL